MITVINEGLNVMPLNAENAPSTLPPLLRLNEIQYYTASNNQDYRITDRLDRCGLYIFGQGSGTFLINGLSFAACQGSCYLLPPGTEIQLVPADSSPVHWYRLLFSIHEAEGSFLSEPLELDIHLLPVLKSRLDQLLRQEKPGDMVMALQRHILFQQIILELLLELRSSEQGEWMEGSHKEEWIQTQRQEAEQAVLHTLAYMHQNYGETITIGRLAQDAHMNRWQYGSLFKSLTGRTPMDYLTGLRIVLSKQLLLAAPGSRLREIAGKVGFQDEYYFSRRFKQSTGISPARYRSLNDGEPRIVCLQYLGELLTLGIRPLGTNRTMHDLLQDLVSDIQAFDEPVSAEELRRLNPDLILFPSFTPAALVRELLQIAPAIEISWEDDVYTRLLKLGRMLGKQDEAVQWITRYENRAEQWRKRLKNRVEVGESASAFVYHQGLYVYSGHHFGHTLYRGLGFAATERIRELMEKEGHLKWKRISPESLADYAGDRVFMAMPMTGPDAVKARQMLLEPCWTQLPAVQNGRAYIMDMSLANYNPVTLDIHLDAVGDCLLK